MKAIVCTAYGPPEVLQLRDVPAPAPRHKEILVRVRATSVTASESLVRGTDVPLLMSIARRLVFGLTKPRRILGFVLAGEVEGTGSGVTRFKKGDQVYGLTGLRFGGYAEYACLPESDSGTRCLALKPDAITFEEAAAIPYGASLATYFLDKASVRSGQRVLVYGASGAIGTTAVQLAKHAGAEVTGVCGTSNLEWVSSLGADTMIDYTRQDDLPDGDVYDLVFDAAGRRKSSKLKVRFRCKTALTPSGRYVSVDDELPKLRPDFLTRMNRLVEAGQFKPVIDRVYPLEQMAEAHRYVDQRHKKGNVVISVGRA